MKIGIIGGGKVGCCLAEYLQNHLVGITASTSEKNQMLANRFHTSCTTTSEVIVQSEVIFLTVPDRKIADVAQAIVLTQNVEDKIFLHCSGSLGLEPLQSLTESGAHCGSLHPLQSFAGGVTQLQGVYMAIDGDETAQGKAKEIVEILGGNSFHVPAKERAAYHAAACFCSNYAVTVEALAQKLMSRWTGSEEAAWQALLPLLREHLPTCKPLAKQVMCSQVQLLVATSTQLKNIYKLYPMNTFSFTNPYVWQPQNLH